MRSEILNILLAGRDTTASLLTNLFFVLARRPDIVAKLRHEITATLGSSDPSTLPTPSQLKDLPYLRACINESLRLHPIVPLNSRQAVRDTVLPVGGGADGSAPVFVAKGEMVVWSLWSMHRRTDIFGADAEEFRPERWTEGSLRPGWGYLPCKFTPR